MIAKPRVQRTKEVAVADRQTDREGAGTTHRLTVRSACPFVSVSTSADQALLEGRKERSNSR